jgi:hypothetical protein
VSASFGTVGLHDFNVSWIGTLIHDRFTVVSGIFACGGTLGFLVVLFGVARK